MFVTEIDIKNSYVKIGEQLKALRIAKGFDTIDSFAEAYNIPRVQYWRMEKGTNFTIKYLLKILYIHEVTLEEFFKEVNI